MRTLQACPRSLSILVPSLLVAAVASAQGTKLNRALARPIGGDIRTAEFNPDGTRVAYVADEETDGVYELFVTKPDAPGAPVKLAGPSVAGGGIYPFDLWMGPKGERVVFVGDLETDGRNEIHSVPLAGGAVVTLNEPMAPNGDVWIATDSVQIDAKETRVVWLANHDGDGAIELFSAPIGGGPSVRLNAPIAGIARDVTSFRIAPGGTHVVYRADQDQDFVEELYSVKITGGPPVRLNPAGREVDEGYRFDASGTRVVFSALTGDLQQNQLYVAALDGSGTALPLLSSSVRDILALTPVPGSSLVMCTLFDGDSRLAAVPLDGSGERILDVRPEGVHRDIAVPPDGAAAIFRVYSLGLLTLERVPVDGSSPAVLIDETNVTPFAFTPDGTRVVYAGATALRSAPVDGGSVPIDLVTFTAFSYVSSFAVTPDGERVAYLAVSYDPTPQLHTSQLYSVPVLGGKLPVLLNGPLTFRGNVQGLSSERPLRLGALGHAVYLADQLEDERYDLFGTPVDGSQPAIRLNGDLPIGPVEGDVLAFGLGGNGEHAVFTADELVDHRFELFGVRTDGSSDPVRLHEPLAQGEAALNFAVSPDGRTAVHWLDRAKTHESELRAVPVVGGPPTVLAGPFAGGSQGRLLIDPTGTWVVFQGASGSARTLSSVPLDGSAASILLASVLSCRSPTFSPDGARLLCLADDDGDYRESLLSLPLDGSAPGLHLEGGGTVRSLTLSPDGTRALFLSDSITPGQFEAFSAPLDGSAAPLRLNPPLAPLADISVLAAAGGFAFYIADQDTLDQLELYRVPLDGSAVSLKLNAPLVARGSVHLFAATPDGSRVVYHADQERDERFELYSVPSDGTGPVRKLNPPVGSGDVSGQTLFDEFFEDVFALSADGSRVAFRADPTVRGSLELLVAPVDGSAPAVRVSPEPQDTSAVLAGFRFSPDGRSLAFGTMSQPGFLQPLDFMLFRAPADGARPAKGIAGPGSEPPEIRWLPGSGRILYRFDAEMRGVVELFTSTGHARRHDAPTRLVTRTR